MFNSTKQCLPLFPVHPLEVGGGARINTLLRYCAYWAALCEWYGHHALSGLPNAVLNLDRYSELLVKMNKTKMTTPTHVLDMNVFI